MSREREWITTILILTDNSAARINKTTMKCKESQFLKRNEMNCNVNWHKWSCVWICTERFLHRIGFQIEKLPNDSLKQPLVCKQINRPYENEMGARMELWITNKCPNKRFTCAIYSPNVWLVDTQTQKKTNRSWMWRTEFLIIPFSIGHKSNHWLFTIRTNAVFVDQISINFTFYVKI